MSSLQGGCSTADPAASGRGRRANVLARSLAATAAILAAAAGISVVPALTTAGQDVLMVESWRAVGLSTFAALFAWLAVRPHGSLSMWLIVLGNKLTLAILGLSFGADVPGALQAAVWDGVLVVLLGLGFTAAMIARRAGDA